MNSLLAMLAQADPSSLLSQQRRITDPRLYPMLGLLGALTLAVVVATAWAVLYYRNQARSRSRPHRSARSKPGSASATEAVAPANAQSERRKVRKRRHPRRPTNPTLAQVGGLPPVRDENTPLPPMP